MPAAVRLRTVAATDEPSAHEPDRPVAPAPTEENLLVVHLDGPILEELARRLEQHGGRRVAARDPWDRLGVTVSDPDGYRLVPCTRDWSNSREPSDG